MSFEQSKQSWINITMELLMLDVLFKNVCFYYAVLCIKNVDFRRISFPSGAKLKWNYTTTALPNKRYSSIPVQYFSNVL